MILIKDLGRIPISEGSKHISRFGIYECSDCEVHFKANSYKVKTRQIEICPTCAKDGRHKRTHGGKGTRLYTIWQNMRDRCNKAYSSSYKYYGEKGIKVCSEWNESFAVFREWANQNGYSEDLTLDRIDSDKDYTPDNCRWVTYNLQSANCNKAANKSSKYLGIDKQGSNYRLRVTWEGEVYYLGMYASEEEAVIARNEFLDNKNYEHKQDKINA